MERDILKYFEDLDDMIGDLVAGQMQIPAAAYFDDDTVINDSVTLFSLDALGGACIDICTQFLLTQDQAATFQFNWFINSIAAPGTFVVQFVPLIESISTAEATRVYRYSFPGILAQGLVLEGRISQDNAGNATNAISGDLSFRS